MKKIFIDFSLIDNTDKLNGEFERNKNMGCFCAQISQINS